ncbi:DUF58 domain-containing protein [Weeksellaceae bacterium TAE3-ERU29]|nr:DUF58 domain-containing protein [Weeksellaceae bacterium TAE3-ERU29]
MDVKEILKRVRRIEIKSKRLTNHLFMGEYNSSFKGRGMIFSEVRPYQFGDDVRNIDWNKTAHFDEPYVKVFEEERENSLVLMVDVSGSQDFGTRKQSKKDTIAEICATLAFSALGNNDKVGLILFSDEVEVYLPPAKGRFHVLRIIRELVEYEPKSKKTSIPGGIDFLLKTQKRKSIVFLLSDFDDVDYKKSMNVAARKHKIVGIRLYDKIERNFPDMGFINMTDNETGKQQLINTSSRKVRKNFESYFQKVSETFFTNLKNAGAGTIEIPTDGDYVKALLNYFKRHKTA